MVDDLYDHTKVHSPVIERAEQLRANLEATFPSFCKALVKSNVTHGFWLVGLIFCPKVKKTIVRPVLKSLICF